jgi:hypothetical protein
MWQQLGWLSMKHIPFALHCAQNSYGLDHPRRLANDAPRCLALESCSALQCMCTTKHGLCSTTPCIGPVTLGEKKCIFC